jgi:hypothetical protein
MMRVTPFRFTTLQCSQIGFTLLRTFTGGSQNYPDRVFGQDPKNRRAVTEMQGREALSTTLLAIRLRA